MATVTFSNGKSVQFDGTPTPQDIDEVAAQFGNQPDASAPAQPSSLADGARSLAQGASHVLNDVEQPFISVAATPVQLGVAASNKFLGTHIADPYAQGVPSLGSTVGLDDDKIPVADATTGRGLLTKAGQVGQIASLVAAPEATGVRAGLAVGAASGVANSLADGNTDPEAVFHDALISGLFGGGIGLAGRTLSAFAGQEALRSGIDPKIATILKRGAAEDPAGTQADLAANVTAALKAAEDPLEENPYGRSQQKLEEAGSILQQKLKAAQKAVGGVLKENGDAPISLDVPDGGADLATGQPSSANVIDSFRQRVKDMFGYEIADDGVPAGSVAAAQPNDPMGSDLAAFMRQHSGDVTSEAPQLVRAEGETRDLPASDQNRILKAYANLQRLQQTPTLRAANGVMGNLDQEANYGTDLFGVNHSKVDALMGMTRHDVSAAARASSPAFADANDAASQLHKLDDFLGAKAGSDLSKGQLLMRRVFYGDQSKAAIELLNGKYDDAGNLVRPGIKQLTGIDLVRQAGLAKFAVENFGDLTQRTGLRQAITGGVNDAEALGGVKTRILSAGYRHLMSPLTPDTQAMATSLAKGRDYSLGKIGEKLDDFIQGPEGSKLQGAFEVGMKDMGVPSTMIKTGAQKLLKTYLFNRLTQPQSAIGGQPAGQ